MSGKGKSVYLIGGGTRGDSQPIALAGVVLKERGYKVVFCSGEENEGFAADFGLEFCEISSIKKPLSENEKAIQAQKTGDLAVFFEAFVTVCAGQAEEDVNAIQSAMNADDHEVAGLVYTSTHVGLGLVLSKKLNIYGQPVMFSPMAANSEFPPYFIDERKPESWQNIPNPDGTTPGPFASCPTPPRFAYPMIWQAFLANLCSQWCAITPVVEKILKIPAADAITQKDILELFDGSNPNSKFAPPFYPATNLVFPGGLDAEYMKNQVLGSVLDTDSKSGSMSGLSEELITFLDAGDAPIYFGWGSMSLGDTSDVLVRAAIGTCKRLGKRGVILRGWAGLTLDMLDSNTKLSSADVADTELETETVTTTSTVGNKTTTVTTTVSTAPPPKSTKPSNQFTDADLIEYANSGQIVFVDRVSHTKLFPKCSCIVTHGGMGTFNATLRSGKPGIITPCWWDQIFTGDRLEFLSCGKRGPNFSQVSYKNLAPLVEGVLVDNSYAARCKEISEIIIAEKGDVAFADGIERGIKNFKK